MSALGKRKNGMTKPAFKKSRFAQKPKISAAFLRSRLPRRELKFFDTTIAFTADATGEIPATGQLNLIPQGVGDNNRVGRMCTLSSLRMQLEVIFTPGAAATASTTLYLYLIQDKQNNGTAPAVTVPLTTATLRDALPNLENSHRFRIHKRWAIALDAKAGVSTAYNNATKMIDYYTKLAVPLEFDSSVSTGAITSIRSNNMFLVAGSSNSDDTINVNGICRVRFSDD